MKKSILAVAVALAASLLHADLLYWQVLEEVGKTFNYAQLYYTTDPGPLTTDGTAVKVGGLVSGSGLTSTSSHAADITGIDNISGFYVGFFSSAEDNYSSLGFSNWLSYSDVLSAMDRSWNDGKNVQTHTSVATFVPEPTSGLLLLLGLAGLAVRRKRA